MKKLFLVGLVGMLVGAGLLWGAQQYAVNGLRCSELRVTYNDDGTVMFLRGDITPLYDGVQVTDVKPFSFTLNGASLPSLIQTTLITLRERAELYGENQTGWVTE